MNDLLSIAKPVNHTEKIVLMGRPTRAPQNTVDKCCDVPGSPCLSKTSPVVGPSFSIFGSLLLGSSI